MNEQKRSLSFPPHTLPSSRSVVLSYRVIDTNETPECAEVRSDSIELRDINDHVTNVATADGEGV